MILCGDALTELRKLAENSIDSIVTDPPYELGFMGKHWDKSGIAYNVEMWKETLRVLKPGGHLLSFGGSRTYHRMACAIEDAGFEIRDQIMWVYGSGFPKSHDVSKAIDKANGVKREVVGKYHMPIDSDAGNAGKVLRSINAQSVFGCTAPHDGHSITAPSTVAARQWQGWGTALKPAHEPICVARKPLSEKTVAENVQKWGTGAMNVNRCRVGKDTSRGDRYNGKPPLGGGRTVCMGKRENPWNVPAGRWPANLIHDGSEEVVGLFPETKSGGQFGYRKYENSMFMNKSQACFIVGIPSDSGSAARFFYCAKASRAEREAGLEGMVVDDKTFRWNKAGEWTNETTKAKNHHPTVKPLALMRYLVRLVTPPNGLVLDPFMGSGTTGMACRAEGLEFIGIEIDKEYFEMAKKRIYGELQEIHI